MQLPNCLASNWQSGYQLTTRDFASLALQGCPFQDLSRPACSKLDNESIALYSLAWSSCVPRKLDRRSYVVSCFCLFLLITSAYFISVRVSISGSKAEQLPMIECKGESEDIARLRDYMQAQPHSVVMLESARNPPSSHRLKQERVRSTRTQHRGTLRIPLGSRIQRPTFSVLPAALRPIGLECGPIG